MMAGGPYSFSFLRYLPFTILLLFHTFTIPNHAFDIPTTIRDMYPAQMVGFYELRGKSYNHDLQRCPGRLFIERVAIAKTHRGNYYVIEHDEIYISPKGSKDATIKCNQQKTPREAQVKLSATLIQEAEQYLRSNYPKPPRELTDLLARSHEKFFIGAEVGHRVCGDHTTSSNTVSVWLAPSKDLEERKSRVRFRSGEKYIVYISKDGPSCLYAGHAWDQGKYQRPQHKPPRNESGHCNPRCSTSPRPASVVPGPNVHPGKKPQGLQSPLPSPAAGQSNCGGGGDDDDDGCSGSTQQPTDSPLPSSDLQVIERGNSASGEPACFPVTAIVDVYGKGHISIADLEVGDYVRIRPDNDNNDRSAAYSPVLLFTHRDAFAKHMFLRIHVSDSNTNNITLTVSPGHYIYLNNCLRPAVEASQGDHVNLVTGVEAKIHSVERVCAKGLFNPQTEHGDIVVDGVVSSTFTVAVRPELAKMLMIPVKLLRWVDSVGHWNESLERTFDWFRGESWVARMIMKMIKFSSQ